MKGGAGAVAVAYAYLFPVALRCGIPLGAIPLGAILRGLYPRAIAYYGVD